MNTMTAKGTLPSRREQSLSLYRHFFGAYPLRVAWMIGFMVVAGLAEGVGVLTLIPILRIAEGAEGDLDPVSSALIAVIRSVGLEPTLPILLGFVVLTVTVKAVMLQLANTQVGYVIAGVTRDLRIRLMQALFAARWSYFGERRVGLFSNAMTVETDRTAATYRESAQVVAAILQMMAYLAVALAISWRLAVAAAGVGAVLTWVARRFMEQSHRAGAERTSGTKSLASRLIDVLQGIKPLKAMGRQGLVWPLLEQEAQTIHRAQRLEISATETLKALHEPILTLFLAIGMFLVLGVTQQPLSETLVLAFIFYRLVVHVNTLHLRYQIMLAGEASLRSLMGEMEAAEAHREVATGKRSIAGVAQGIRLEDVHFAYADDEPVLRGVNLEIPAGSFVAIHGRSGAGKTTLVDLLVRLHEPRQGRILVDGIPLEEVDLDVWRKQIGYVPQETLLFNTSILENLTLGESSYSPRDAEEALRMADAWDFVEARPEGLNASVGERGTGLSGGQRQRLAIARALLGHPSVLILDEVTTSLDPETEQAICATLKHLAGAITIVSISHQPALRAIADIVYRIDNGRVEIVDEFIGSAKA